MREDTDKAQKHIVGLERALRSIATEAMGAGEFDLANDATELAGEAYLLHARMGRVAETHSGVLFADPTRRGDR